MSLTAIFQRLDGSRITRTLRLANPTDEMCLIPMRSLLTGEVEATKLFDRTQETQDGLPVFVQNAEHDPLAGLELFGGRN